VGPIGDRIGSQGEPGRDADSSRRPVRLVPGRTERKPSVVRPRLNQKIVVGTVFVSAMFMNIMDITIVNVALPTIGRDFHVAPTAVDGIVIAYLVSLAVFIPASGWLGDRFGGKRVLLIAIAVFTAGSVLCGLAQNMTELVLFRILQGAGGGMMAPVGMAMLYRVFPPAERVRAASILTVPTTLAPALGPVLGGFLVTSFSWRWVFFVNLPIGIVAIVFGALFLEQTGTIDAGRLDVPGFVLGGAGLGLLMYGVSEGPLESWSSPEVVASCVVGLALLAVFVMIELRTTRPLVDLRLLKGRLFRSTNVVMFLVAAAFLGTLYLVPLYFQDARGLSALQSGLSTFPEAFGVMLGAQFASRLIYPRIGPRRHISGGLIGLALGLLLGTQVTLTTNLWLIRGVMFLLGWMMAQVMVPNQAASFAMISAESMGRASTFFNTMRQVGSATGVAVLSTVLIGVGSAEASGGTGSPDITAYHLAFLTAACFALVAVFFSLTIHDSDAAETIVRRPRRRRVAPVVPDAVRVPESSPV
jgi:EmrB/QacA subfamily drug resistance transporter